jgi:hypothetical protein
MCAARICILTPTPPFSGLLSGAATEFKQFKEFIRIKRNSRRSYDGADKLTMWAVKTDRTSETML